MADTLYASTPSEGTPPHPLPLEIALKRAPERAASSQRPAVERRHAISLFPSAADALGRQGFARVINRLEEAGEVRIEAFDDAGVMHGPATLSIGTYIVDLMVFPRIIPGGARTLPIRE